MVKGRIFLQLIDEVNDDGNFMAHCAEQGIFHEESSSLALVKTRHHQDTRLELRKLDEPKLGAVFVDFTSGTMAHRRKFGGGRGEAIVKAMGLKAGYFPDVLDGTAGLGRDAFVLASVGCKVRLIERHAVAYLLLQDGLRRAYDDAEIGAMMRENMRLLTVRHLADLPSDQKYCDVVYLDPMYPHKSKSALVKKEMRLFQVLIGADLDSDTLFAPALRLAKKRVVVKRPDYAEPLAQVLPQITRKTKNHRFDIYLPSGI